MTYDVGGMGLGPGTNELLDVPLEMAPDLQSVQSRTGLHSGTASGGMVYNVLAPSFSPAIVPGYLSQGEGQVGAGAGVADPMPVQSDFASPGKDITPEQLDRYNATVRTWHERNQLAPENNPPATGGAKGQADPDAGRVLPDGTPVSVAKRFIRMYEPGADGYNSRWGYKGGMPSGYGMTETGFPDLEGRSIPSDLYGGRYAGMNSSASGMYQFEKATWEGAVKGLAEQGVEVKDFSPESQEKVATYLLEHNGMGDWAPYNSRLSSAYGAYKATGNMPGFAGSPLAYWEEGYSPGATVGGVHGYASGQRVPGTGYAVGGRLAGVTQPPQQYGMVTPVVDDNPFAAKAPGQVNTPAQDLSEINRRERTMQALQMWSVLGGMNRGIKFTPVSYDPFKVKEAGTPQGGSVEIPVERVGAGGAGPVGWNALQYRMPVRGVTTRTG